MSIKSLIVHNPATGGDNNSKLRVKLGLIVDNWRSVTPIQASIALTLYNAYRPAEAMSIKQAWHIEKAIAVLALNDLDEPN
jgi:hypothetical protein